jgi:hypothetical protein
MISKIIDQCTNNNDIEIKDEDDEDDLNKSPGHLYDYNTDKLTKLNSITVTNHDIIKLNQNFNNTKSSELKIESQKIIDQYLIAFDHDGSQSDDGSTIVPRPASALSSSAIKKDTNSQLSPQQMLDQIYSNTDHDESCSNENKILVQSFNRGRESASVKAPTLAESGSNHCQILNSKPSYPQAGIDPCSNRNWYFLKSRHIYNSFHVYTCFLIEYLLLMT